MKLQKPCTWSSILELWSKECHLQIQNQLASLTAKQPISSAPLKAYRPSFGRSAVDKKPTPPKPSCCFRCGEDGQTKPQCENEPILLWLLKRGKSSTPSTKSARKKLNLPPTQFLLEDKRWPVQTNVLHYRNVPASSIWQETSSETTCQAAQSTCRF